METQKKIYVGRAKIVNTKFGEMIKLLQHKDNLNEMLNYMADNKTDWITIDIQQMKQPDKLGKTHSASIDTWKPEKKSEPTFPQPVFDKMAQTETIEPSNELPF